MFQERRSLVRRSRITVRTGIFTTECTEEHGDGVVANEANAERGAEGRGSRTKDEHEDEED